MNKSTRLTGWLAVVGATLALMVGQGPINVFAAGIFLKPVAADLGFSRGQVSTAIGVANLMVAVFAPLFGMAVDRFGVRRPLMVSICLFAAATAAVSLSTRDALVLILLYAVSGAVGIGQNPGPYSKIISEWFDAKRGLALGIILSGVGLGTAIIPQLSAMLVANFGWRTGYVGLGGLILLLGLIPVFLFVKEPPQDNVELRVIAKTGLERREIFRSRTFWAMGLSFFVVGVAINGALVHVVPLLTDRGYTVPQAVNVISLSGLGLIAGRLLTGYLMDKIHAPILGMLFLLIPAAGLSVLSMGTVGSGALIGAVLLGLGVGGEIDLMSYLVSRYFGQLHFGVAHGTLFSFSVIGNSVGATALGWAFGTYGSYNGALVVCAAALVICSVLLATLGRYRFPPMGAPGPISRGVPAANLKTTAKSF